MGIRPLELSPFLDLASPPLPDETSTTEQPARYPRRWIPHGRFFEGSSWDSIFLKRWEAKQWHGLTQVLPGYPFVSCGSINHTKILDDLILKHVTPVPAPSLLPDAYQVRPLSGGFALFVFKANKYLMPFPSTDLSDIYEWRKITEATENTTVFLNGLCFQVQPKQNIVNVSGEALDDEIRLECRDLQEVVERARVAQHDFRYRLTKHLQLQLPEMHAESIALQLVGLQNILD